MKKVLYAILAILGFLYLTGMIVLGLNGIVPFFTIPSDFTVIVAYVAQYGGLVIIALTLFVAFWARGIKILFLLLTIIVIAAGVMVFAFPEVVGSIFGV